MGRGNEQTVQMSSLALQMSSQCRELSCLLASKEDKQIQQISEKILNIIFTESDSEVIQSCPTLWDPMDCSLPGSSIHGIFQARVLEWGAIAFSRGIFPTQGLNPGLLHCRRTLYPLSHQGSPFSLGKCKSKSQCDTTSHLLRYPLSKNQKIANVDKDVETLEPLCPIDVKLCW